MLRKLAPPGPCFFSSQLNPATDAFLGLHLACRTADGQTGRNKQPRRHKLKRVDKLTDLFADKVKELLGPLEQRLQRVELEIVQQGQRTQRVVLQQGTVLEELVRERRVSYGLDEERRESLTLDGGGMHCQLHGELDGHG